MGNGVVVNLVVGITVGIGEGVRVTVGPGIGTGEGVSIVAENGVGVITDVASNDGTCIVETTVLVGLDVTDSVVTHPLTKKTKISILCFINREMIIVPIS